jgi:hypothetical protein
VSAVARWREEVRTAPGGGLIRASWLGTLVFTAGAVAALLAPEALGRPFAVLAGALFFGGIAAFGVAYFRAIGRSRTDLIGVGGLFFLAGCAPTGVQLTMMASLALEVVVGVATAAIRFSSLADDDLNPLAFGILVPMWALGLAGLWGARHGVFPSRPSQPTRERGVRSGP